MLNFESDPLKKLLEVFLVAITLISFIFLIYSYLDISLIDIILIVLLILLIIVSLAIYISINRLNIRLFFLLIELVELGLRELKREGRDNLKFMVKRAVRDNLKFMDNLSYTYYRLHGLERYYNKLLKLKINEEIFIKMVVISIISSAFFMVLFGTLGILIGGYLGAILYFIYFIKELERIKKQIRSFRGEIF